MDFDSYSALLFSRRDRPRASVKTLPPLRRQCSAFSLYWR
jgi:hypothetical protein